MFDHLPNKLPTPDEFARRVLELRQECVRFLEEAQNAGKKREARGYQSVLRKWDALIAKYGLERYARTHRV
jgi:hypothetical protein